MTADQDLAGLPEDVREAWRNIDYATPDVRGTCIAPTAALETIFHDHMRLARENAEFRGTVTEVQRNYADFRREAYATEDAYDALRECAERAEAKLAAIKATPTGTVLDWALRRAESAESELAALKRRIAEAPKAAVHDDANLGPSLVAYMDATDLGKTFALLPVGGE